VIGRSVLGAGVLLCGLSAAATPRPSPTPTSLELLRARVTSDAVVGADPSLHFVIALRLVDTHEAFTITLHGERLDVAEGLPRSASVALSGRRSTMVNIFRGRETISGAVRRNLVDVRGDMDRLFQLFECCVRPRPTPTPSATAR
jgi:hypothetical protein